MSVNVNKKLLLNETYKKYEDIVIRQLEQEYRNRMRACYGKGTNRFERIDIWLSGDDYEKLCNIRYVMGLDIDEIYSLALDEYYKSHGIREAIEEAK